MEKSLEIKNLKAQLAKAERQSKSDRAFINKLIAQKKELENKLSLLFTELSKYEGARGLHIKLSKLIKMRNILVAVEKSQN
jgi:hypothetical protein